MITQAPNYARRKWVDRFMRRLTVGATILALIPLVLILGYVVIRGAGALNVAFFTQAYEPPVVGAGGEIGNAGGVLHGIVGSLIIVGLALLMALPIGILAAIFLAEYPANGIATAVRFCTEAQTTSTSIPPSPAMAACTQRRASPGREKSASIARPRPPRSWMSDTVVSDACGRPKAVSAVREKWMATSAPASAKAIAISRPRLTLPPVTRARRPFIVKRSAIAAALRAAICFGDDMANA